MKQQTELENWQKQNYRYMKERRKIREKER